MSTKHKHKLENYQPHPFYVDYVYLDINVLSASEVVVQSYLEVRLLQKELVDLELDGVNLDTREISLNGRVLRPDMYAIEGNKLRLSKSALAAGGSKNWKFGAKVRLNPTANTSLQGLYTSSGVLVSQCEAEGFRRITWFIDRPDIMSRYICRLEADANLFPVLLSNGNIRDKGDLPVGRHFCEYSDPNPKPCYLFAVAAGKLASVSDRHLTKSGKSIELNLYAAPNHVEDCRFALRSLQKAMAFDEERYGLEYDLDQFSIVAVDDFNAGAMENTSLNIFNSTYLLANQNISTDADYERVEAIIAHEYFHNYTGNKVTLRDWFQLCWKEGLTVYRDQQFTADAHSTSLKRIADVALIQERQFLEDQSSLRHAPYPDAYNEIDNLYTLTVYEKGAEIMRVLERLLGRVKFDAQLQKFLLGHSGKAITIEQFIEAMLASAKVKPAKFLRWFKYSGCPGLRARWQDAGDGLKTLELQQLRHDGRPLPESEALVMPVQVALLDKNGVSEETSLLLDKAKKSWNFGCAPNTTISLLRDFSAPVRLEMDYGLSELALIQDKETDAVSRWWANRQLWLAALSGKDSEQAWRYLLKFFDKHLARYDAGDAEARLLLAKLISPPSFDWFMDQYEQAQPLELWGQLRELKVKISCEFAQRWGRIYADLWAQRSHSYIWNTSQCAHRAWQNLALEYQFNSDPSGAWPAVSAQLEQSDNFTDASAALRIVLANGSLDQAQRISTAFNNKWVTHNNCYQSWLRAWASRPRADTLTQVQRLMEMPKFLISNPNHVHALIGCFARNLPAVFSQPEISLAFVETEIARIDARNPQLAARLATSLADRPKLADACRELLQASRERLLQSERLSAQTRDQLGGG